MISEWFGVIKIEDTYKVCSVEIGRKVFETELRDV